MINREGKLNLSTSGGSDLNQELVENSDHTKLTPENEMRNDDGIEPSSISKSDDKMTGESSSIPDSISITGENEENDNNKKAEEGENNIANESNNYKVSDMNSRMSVNADKDNKSEGNTEPSLRENTLTKSDVPYDVPNDQTPRLSDMPNNIEQMTKKEAPNQTGSE